MQSLTFATLPPQNENHDTAGKYSNTYFRIDTKAYSPSSGWNESKKHAYEVELRAILTAQGWEIEPPAMECASMNAIKDRSCLYLHPQNYSGVCENSEREKLFEAFRAAENFTCRAVDVYEEVFDMTDRQLTDKLNNETTEIEAELLEALTTKRKNLYIVDVGFFGVCGNIAKRHSIKRLAITGKRSKCTGIDETSNGICNTFVSEIFNRLVAEGKIIRAKTKRGEGFRTAQKGDKIQIS